MNTCSQAWVCKNAARAALRATAEVLPKGGRALAPLQGQALGIFLRYCPRLEELRLLGLLLACQCVQAVLRTAEVSGKQARPRANLHRKRLGRPCQRPRRPAPSSQARLPGWAIEGNLAAPLRVFSGCCTSAAAELPKMQRLISAPELASRGHPFRVTGWLRQASP